MQQDDCWSRGSGIKPRGVQVKQEFGWFAWVAASKSWSWPFKHQRIRIPITHGGIEFNKCTTRIGIHCLPVSSVFSGLATLKIHGKKNHPNPQNDLQIPTFWSLATDVLESLDGPDLIAGSGVWPKATPIFSIALESGKVFMLQAVTSRSLITGYYRCLGITSKGVADREKAKANTKYCNSTTTPEPLMSQRGQMTYKCSAEAGH